MTTELEAFRAVDLNWVRQLRSIWRDQSYHVDSLHQALIDDMVDYFTKETRDSDPDNEPQGRVVIGPAGLGKTHLIGELRRRVWQHDGFFVLLDFVGIKDFWPSVALGFLNSLQVRMTETLTLLPLANSRVGCPRAPAPIRCGRSSRSATRTGMW